jgi:uncharacterized tellurite resistance protein B-like protein
MSETTLTPLAAFEAALLTWAAEPARPAHLAQLPDRTKSEAWLKENDEAALRAALPTILDGPQCVCLLANLAFMIGHRENRDGRRLVEDLGEEFRVERSDVRDLLRSMDSLTEKDTLREEEDRIAATALLLLLSSADGRECGAEEVFLQEFAGSETALASARTIVQEQDEETILKNAADMPSRARRQLAGKLFQLMFSDGQWSDGEQALLDKAAGKLYVSRSDLENLLRATHAMYSLKVFES